MRNIARVFWRDVKRLARTPAAWSVVLFLCVLPSLYTWFNVAAFWNPYDNTGDLRICVVNEDAGYDDEKLGHLDAGAALVDQLQDNDQLGWAFVDYDEAMDEVNSGEAYAAFVVPETFSADLASLASGDLEQPKLEYYVNEKLGPVSPKITDTGANALDTTINDAFFSTVSSTVASILNERIDAASMKLAASKSRASQQLSNAVDDLEDARATIANIQDSAAGAQDKISSAKSALAGADARLSSLSDDLDEAADLVADANTKLSALSAQANSALDKGASKLSSASAQANVALAQTAAAIQAAKGALGIPDGGAPLDYDYTDVIALLQSIRPLLADADKQAQVDQLIDQLQTQGPKWSADIDAINKALDEAAATASGTASPLNDAVDDALASADAYRASVADKAMPAISEALGRVATVSSRLNASVKSEKVIVAQATTVLDGLSETLAGATDALGKTDALLAGLERDLAVVQSDMESLALSDALAQIAGEDGVDPDKVAEFMMSPTQVQNEELYPMNAYGSAMASLFINLTLWIGVFMLMVIFKLEVDEEGIEGLTITQRYFGRVALLAIIAAAQAAVCCTGCLLLGVQSASLPAFYLTAIIASLSYLAIQYTLSATLQHVGKAICVILVFVQIPAATGLYPIEMTTDFFRVTYPMFPFTYGINAMRETIGGFYGTAWLSYIGALLWFLAVFVLIGVVVRPYLTNLNRMFAREIEESDIIIGESVQLPARRYRMSQVIRAFTDREEYRSAIDRRALRFMELYPKLMRGALLAGIGVPVVITAVLAALSVDKVFILSTWLVWFLAIALFAIVAEYFRDYLSHLVSLESMSDDEVRTLLKDRQRFTRVQPVIHGLRARYGAPAEEAGGEAAAEDAEDAPDEAPEADDGARGGAPDEEGEDA